LLVKVVADGRNAGPGGSAQNAGRERRLADAALGTNKRDEGHFTLPGPARE
jgi:hypothetical protein